MANSIITEQDVKDIFTQMTSANYSAGVPRIPPHRHNGIDNLQIQASDILGLSTGSSGFTLTTGDVFFSAGTSTTRTGALLCDSSPVSRTTYATLFAKIGTTWGNGDGTTTFNLPPGAYVPVPFLSGDANFSPIGKTLGEATHTLTITEMPAHGHQINSGGTSGGLDSAAGTANFNSGNRGTVTAVQPNGGSGAHNNIQPSMVMALFIVI